MGSVRAGCVPPPQPSAGGWEWAQVGTGCGAEAGQGCGELEMDPAAAAPSLRQGMMALEGWAGVGRSSDAH